MKLSNKHGDAATRIIRADFSGGLNTAANSDGIAENQLADCLNVEADRNTGRLKTVAGTVDVFKSETEIYAAMYDEINRVFLLVDTEKNIRVLNPRNLEVGDSLGTLSGVLYPVATSWENGILIASGGKLQYYDGTGLVTEDSPSAASVYIRAGRVLVTENSNIRYSGVGDETNWTENTDDDSSSKFVEAGYKDGGKIIGMSNLSQDILIIKDNGRIYRLSGEYPDWAINEVSRNVECSGRMSYCAVADSVFVLGKNEVQVLQTTQSYGDVKPSNVASLVVNEIQKLPANAIMRFVPPLNQIWCVGTDGIVMLYSLDSQAWFKRKFNSPVVDIISVGDEVFVIKPTGISKLDEGTFFDSDMALEWRFQGQRLISQHDYLLKRTQVSVIPLSEKLYSGQIQAGAVVGGI